jgi:hypothetical protein
MADLSPAAQAVMDAMHRSYDHEPTRRAVAAGVLRASSDRLGDLIGDICHIKFEEAILASQDFLERIAAELEGRPDG